MAVYSLMRGFVCTAAATLMLLVTGGPALAQPVQVLSDGGGVHAGQLIVPMNQSQVLRVDRPFAQALIGNEEIADVLPLTNQSLYVLGKSNGTTSLTLYDRSRTLIAIIDVVVGPDVVSLERQLGELIPNEPIGVRLSNGSVVLTGVVGNAPAAQRAAQIAETFSPGKVINMLSVGSSQQVMLEVRFSEMRRGAARRLGFNSAFISDSGDFQGAIGDRGPSSALLTNEAGVPTIDIGGILDAFGIVAGGVGVGSLNIFGALDALERNGVVTTLAEPTLIALSGETASFLAGGEFPIPVLQGSGGGTGSDSTGRGITIEYKPFGVSLAFTPTVLADGMISLVVAPEVSSLDQNAAINLNGLVIPGLQVRRARTTLELRDGQSFAMAGLLRRDFSTTIRRFPILGSLPIIGALFRSTGFQNEDTELVIIVTPRLVRPVRADRLRLPSDRVQPPSEADLFLRGRTDSAVPPDPVIPKRFNEPVAQGRRPGGTPAPAPAGPPPLPDHLLEEPSQ
jgi:pilus assembly protein CpaC